MLTTNDGVKDNGCIINTAFQVASDPVKIAISCQRYNYSREIIEKTGKFNLSVLTEKVPFDLIKRFGMQTGANADKFSDFTKIEKTENGLVRLTDYANAYFSIEVKESLDLGSHVMFIGEIKESKILSSDKPCTYAYYHSNIKPKK